MGELVERVKLSLLTHGNGEVDNFIKNSDWFVGKYRKTDDDVNAITLNKINIGGFYFLHYNDKSNWMRFAPIFLVKYNVEKIPKIYAINFNFIPIQYRILIFDKYITKKDFDDNNYLKVDYESVYNELRSIGFEYALMEFNLHQILQVHRISLNVLPRFFYSQHPLNKYDPKKLMEIWFAKIEKRDQRHAEMMNSMISDFYDIDKEISEKYNVLKGHIQRLQNSIKNSKK